MIARTHRPDVRAARRARQSGAAAIEFLFVTMLVLIPVLSGTIEVGRMIHVQQIVANSAREGARMAAQAVTIREDGAPIQILNSVDPPAAGVPGSPNVKSAVVQTLYGSGLKSLLWDDVTCSFAFLDSPTGSVPGATEPWQGVQGQKFRVSVTVPWQKVRWDFTPGIVNPTTIGYTVDARILVDLAFSLNTSLPGVNPLP